MDAFVGVDIGSTAIKVVALDAAGAVLGRHAAPTGALFERNASEALAAALAAAGVGRERVRGLVATGYGRKLFKAADAAISEISANALGVLPLSAGTDRVRTVINIGGQDSKVIQLAADGGVRSFVMNDKCAAGTGRFLEMASVILEVALDEMGAHHLAAAGPPLPVNATCTVFAESEIVSLLARGHGKGEIIAGVHHAIAHRIARLARKLVVEEPVVFDGGPALNPGLVRALEEELGRPVRVPEDPRFTTAHGAALHARAERHGRGEA